MHFTFHQKLKCNVPATTLIRSVTTPEVQARGTQVSHHKLLFGPAGDVNKCQPPAHWAQPDGERGGEMP